MAEISSEWLKTASLDLHYLRAGSGPAVILLHGWPEFSGVWKHNIPALAGRHDVIAPDLRRFGRTRPLNPDDCTPTNPEVLAGDLADLMDGLGIARTVIVSHDIGAFVAQRFARHSPERVAGLVFFNCPYPGIGRRWAAPDHLREIWYQSFHQQPWAAELVGHNRDTCRIYFRHFLSHWSHDPHAFDDDLEDWVENFMQADNIQGGFDWYAGVNEMRLRTMKGLVDPEPPIEVPVRVLWGAHDPVIKCEWADRLGDHFTDAEITIVARAGHFVHYERPDYANREMLAFLARIFPQDPT
ncbi:MAG: alpha/beta hydrolase [Alphaproteobacteria bacterium]|nr:alpha/beta hydrolase [Alphaproteobacteria bacterium]